MKELKRLAIVCIVGLALLAQLMNPLPAYAEGETTPAPSDVPAETATPEPTEVVVDATASESPTPEPIELPTEVTPAESLAADPLATTEPATDAATLTTEPVETATPFPPTDQPEATAEPAEATPEAAPTSLPETLAELPEDTAVVVVDENGQPLPLVTQEAAEAIVTGDPMWCPYGTVPGGFGCTSSYATMEELLTNAGTYIDTYPFPGMVWIASGNIGDVNPITIDGLSYPNWANGGLELQGGWSGIIGDTSIGSNSVFSVPITVTNWNSAIRIQNIDAPSITVSDTVSNTPSGTIIIRDVNSDVNLDNVTVTGSALVGIYVRTSGKITGNNLNASANASTGADLSGVLGVTLTGTNVFVGNGTGVQALPSSLVGLVVSSSAGAVTLNNVNASGTLGSGASLYGASGVTLTGTNVFDGNFGGGLYASSGGAMVLNNITASNHVDGIGAALNSGGDLTLTGTNFFNGNWFGGLSAYAGGAMTLNSVTASNNGGWGASLNGTNDITLTGTNVFSSNSSAGLFAQGSGSLTLNNVTASSNGWYGAYVDNKIYGTPGNITITGSTFSDNICDCAGSGAHVLSTGNVSINQSFFNRDSLYINAAGSVTTNGVVINAAQGTGLGVETAGGDVTLSNTRVVNSIPNYNIPTFPYGDGADIFPNGGNVTVTDSEFSGNDWGLWVRDGNQVTITNSKFDSTLAPFNNIDLSVWCALANFALSFPQDTPISLNIGPDCAYSTPVNSASNEPVAFITEIAERLSLRGDVSIARIPYRGKAEIWLNCTIQKNFKINLPNGDRVDIYCPVSGKGVITRLDNTTLPAELPTGYTFASALEVEILQPDPPLRRDPETHDYVRRPISVINGDGHIMASFVATPLQPGKSFSILYWDEATSRWIPLKDHLVGRKFKLVPEDPQDERLILAGVLPNLKIVPQRVQVTTNFPGIYVLAQH